MELTLHVTNAPHAGRPTASVAVSSPGHADMLSDSWFGAQDAEALAHHLRSVGWQLVGCWLAVGRLLDAWQLGCWLKRRGPHWQPPKAITCCHTHWVTLADSRGSSASADITLMPAWRHRSHKAGPSQASTSRLTSGSAAASQVSRSEPAGRAALCSPWSSSWALRALAVAKGGGSAGARAVRGGGSAVSAGPPLILRHQPPSTCP